MNPLRWQLPVHSPLPWRAVLASVSSGDPRERVADVLGRLYDMPRARLTDSGTSALALALRCAAANRPDGYCLLPAYGCYDLATAALAAGVRVELYDLVADTLAPRVDSLACLITRSCAALVVVAHYGLPTPMSEWRRLAASAGVPVIEDAAQASGAFWENRRSGSQGDATVLSFGRGKGVTGGSGGALLLSGALAETAAWNGTERLLEHPDAQGASFVKLAAQYLLARPGLYGVPARIPMLRLGETLFRPPAELRRMAPQSARVLEQTIQSMDATADVRRAHADRLRLTQSRLAPRTLVRADPRARPGWLRLPVLIEPPESRLRAAAARIGIARGYPRALYELEQLKPVLRPSSAGAFPGAAELSRKLWTLPTHGLLRERDLTALERWIGGFVSVAE